MRTIDADLLKEGFEEDGHLTPYVEGFIDACPTVETAPVVRCGKCRWYNPVFYACDKHGICKPVDWFCGDGEEEHNVRNGKE